MIFIKKFAEDVETRFDALKLKFKNYQNCLRATLLEHKINHLEKNKIDIDSLKKDHKEFIRNKLILKTHQKFKS